MISLKQRKSAVVASKRQSKALNKVNAVKSKNAADQYAAYSKETKQQTFNQA